MHTIGQAGNLQENTTFTGEEIFVKFAGDVTLDDPVIHLSGTNFGGNKFSFRITEVVEGDDGEAVGFRFTIDEWENHDGKHPAVEQIHWLAVESGVHTLPDGRVIEAGHANADSDGETVQLSGDFATPPTVLTTVASNNHDSNVDSDPYNISKTSFELNVEEAESQDGVHGLENVGWIAIAPGGDGTSGTAKTVGDIDSSWEQDIDYDAEYEDAVVLVESQTQNDSDTGNVIMRRIEDDRVDLRFEEDTSVDRDSGHIDEVAALVTFESGNIACFTPDTRVLTPHGPRPILDLTAGDLVITRDNGLQPLRLTMTADRDPTNAHHTPICIEPNALAPGVPTRRIWLSPQHRVLITGWQAELYAGSSEVLVPARALENGTTIRTDPTGSRTYVHLLFDTHQVIETDGLASESLHPGEMARTALGGADKAELFALFPDLRTDTTGYGPTARHATTVSQGRLFAA